MTDTRAKYGQDELRTKVFSLPTCDKITTDNPENVSFERDVRRANMYMKLNGGSYLSSSDDAPLTCVGRWDSLPTEHVLP